MRPFNVVEGEGVLRLELEPTFKVSSSKYLKKSTTGKYEACVAICKVRHTADYISENFLDIIKK